MISTEYYSIGRKFHFLGTRIDKIPEIFRFHASISAKLIDLVRGGFNEHHASLLLCFAESRLNNVWVRTTD